MPSMRPATKLTASCSRVWFKWISSSNQPPASDVVSEAAAAQEAKAKAKPVRTGPKVGRNDPCPCGSGKKYKQCCGR